MEPTVASRTALGAAAHRAAHQTLEGGRIFSDPLALAILGADAEPLIARITERLEGRRLRLFIAVRSRFAEDCASRTIHEGVRQIIVLGAGLDTFAYRLNALQGLRVFELDHPVSQRDKRRRLEEAGVSEPAHVAYIAHDFENGAMAPALIGAGFNPDRRSFIMWLGVTPYLAEDAVFGTLSELARFPAGVEIVFDYPNPVESIPDAAARAALEELARRVTELGEPFRCALDTEALHTRAQALGYIEVEDHDGGSLAARYLPDLEGMSLGRGGHVVRLATRGRPRSAAERHGDKRPART